MSINRRNAKLVSSWVGWVGDMGHVTEYLLTKPWASPWCVPKTVNSILRAVGVVAFANSPLAGFLIVLAMFVGNKAVFAAAVLAGVIGVVMSKVLRQPERLISDGVTVFNGILVACISVAVFPAVSGRQLDAVFWLFVTAAVLVCSYVDLGLNSIMAASKLPALSIPFNFTAAILLLAMRGGAGLWGTQLTRPTAEVTLEVTEANMTGHEEVDWSKVMEGTVLAAGQIYGVGTLDSSILVLLGFFLFSPLLSAFFYMGSVVGSVVGVMASTAPYTDVYQGLWGYNAMLTAGGMSYFLVPTLALLPAAVVGATLAAAVQAATLHVFSPSSVPVLSYPFNVATLLFLAASTAPDPPFVWVANKTFPELHLAKHILAQRRKVELEPDVEGPLHTTKE